MVIGPEIELLKIAGSRNSRGTEGLVDKRDLNPIYPGDVVFRFTACF